MSVVHYYRDFMSPDYATWSYNGLRHIDWERRIDAPRSEYWCNDYDQPYTYGQGKGERTYEARPMPTYVGLIRETLKSFMHYDWLYEGCFLNMYEDGTDALGWHTDNDPGIDHSRPIAVVTLGASRRIEYKEFSFKGHAPGVELEHGSLFLMATGMQQTHLHRIPKIHHPIGPRISLTYRALR